jgi:hypothetical protein
VDTTVGPIDSRAPGRIQWRKVSLSGRTVLAALAGMVVYAIARCIDEVGRIHFLTDVQHRVHARQVALGQTTWDAVRASARALDNRSHIFVLLSWVGGLALFGAYRYWRSENPTLTPHTVATRFMERAAGAIYVTAIAVQFIPVSNASGTPNVNSSLTAAKATLVSRGLLVPAALLSAFVLLYREGAWAVAGETIPGTELQPKRQELRIRWLLRSLVLGCLYFGGVCALLLTIPQLHDAGTFAGAATAAIGALMLVVAEGLRQATRRFVAD